METLESRWILAQFTGASVRCTGERGGGTEVKWEESLRVTEGKHSHMSIQKMEGGVELFGGLQGKATLSPSSNFFSKVCVFSRKG